MSTNVVSDAVRQFIVAHFARPDARRLEDDDPLLKGGIVDSMGVLEIVTFIESEFSLTVDDEDLSPEHFDTIRRITAYIARKQARPDQ